MIDRAIEAWIRSDRIYSRAFATLKDRASDPLSSRDLEGRDGPFPLDEEEAEHGAALDESGDTRPFTGEERDGGLEELSEEFIGFSSEEDPMTEGEECADPLLCRAWDRCWR